MTWLLIGLALVLFVVLVRRWEALQDRLYYIFEAVTGYLFGFLDIIDSRTERWWLVPRIISCIVLGIVWIFATIIMFIIGVVLFGYMRTLECGDELF